MVGTKKCEYVGLTPLLTSSKINLDESFDPLLTRIKPNASFDN